ncbi:MAG: SpoIIE family protein phosphatase [Clostridia bacterium]|nr:SpoIIE family protein phosphatase [Clostridia bacterium]
MKTKLLRALASAGVCFALTYLLSAARFPFGLSPFYLGAYAALLAMGENYFALTAAYLLARYLSAPSLLSLLSATFAAAGAGVLRLLPILFRRRFSSFYTVLAAFLTELLTMIFLPRGDLFSFLGNAALSCLFALLCLRLAGRSGRRVLRLGRELPLVLLFAFAFGAGARGVIFFGITPYYLLLAFLLPLTALLGSEGGAIPLAFAIGGTAVSGEAALPLGAALAWAFAAATREERRIAGFALPLSEGLLYLLGAASFSPLNFPMMLGGAIFAAFLPEPFYRRMGVRLGKSENSAAHALVNKARLDVSGKLGYVSGALRAMSDSLYLIEPEDDSRAAERLARDFARDLCAGCKGYRDCAAQGGGGTSTLFEPPIRRAIETGRASICDLPSYLNANCHKIKEVLNALSQAAELYAAEKERASLLRSERERMASEAEGIAGVLDELRKETRRVLSFDGKREKRVLAELWTAGVSAYDAMVTEDETGTGVTVTMDGDRAEEPRVLRAVSRAMDLPLIPESVSVLGAGSASVTFAAAPQYDALVGEAVRVKEGSEACGDTKSVTRLGGDRIMIALSDGMGSGEEANRGSSAAIALVENFYRTGVDERVVLPLINRLLTMRNDGSFQTLDMCVVNLRTGEADFIKLCAPESVILRKEGCEVVEGGSLPLGILREVRPVISRRKLGSGDVVVLATDGVTDAIGVEGVVRVAESGRTNNPQTVADNVVRDAAYVSAADDQTVVALRLFRRL